MKSRVNPFASRHIESLPYQFTALSLNAVMERLAAQRYRGAIIGPCGSGKTTLLETIGRRLEQTGFCCCYLYLKKENRPVYTPWPKPLSGRDAANTAFLIDGTEQLSRPSWFGLYFRIRAAGAIVVTTHGKSLLPPLVHTRTSPALLHDLVRQLTGKAETISEPAIVDLYRRHQGDIRQALRELYDVWAARA
ncbi:MAG: hypothetical protein AB1724_02365 [Thermodesulfobacteriota bacterium]